METAKNIQEVALDEKESRLRQKGFARKIKKNTHTQVALTGLRMYGINSKSNGVGVVRMYVTTCVTNMNPVHLQQFLPNFHN